MITGHWEVVVVGGRIAGASTAWALAPYAERILVVDASRPSTFWPQQSTWDRSGNLAWVELGLLDTVLACGPPHRRVGRGTRGLAGPNVPVRGEPEQAGPHQRSAAGRERCTAVLPDRGPGRAEGRRIHRPVQPHHERDTVGDLARVELVERPHPALRRDAGNSITAMSAFLPVDCDDP